MTIRLLFEPRDLWVGIYWRRGWESGRRTWTIYVCLVPMLPVQVHFYTRGGR